MAKNTTMRSAAMKLMESGMAVMDKPCNSETFNKKKQIILQEENTEMMKQKARELAMQNKDVRQIDMFGD